MFLILLL